MTANGARWTKFLIAILLGNSFYYVVSPYLPAAAQHRAFRPDLGTLVDLWFCLFVFGILELAAFLSTTRKKTGQ